MLFREKKQGYLRVKININISLQSLSVCSWAKGNCKQLVFNWIDRNTRNLALGIESDVIKDAFVKKTTTTNYAIRETSSKLVKCRWIRTSSAEVDISLGNLISHVQLHWLTASCLHLEISVTINFCSFSPYIHLKNQKNVVISLSFRWKWKLACWLITINDAPKTCVNMFSSDFCARF